MGALVLLVGLLGYPVGTALAAVVVRVPRRVTVRQAGPGCVQCAEAVTAGHVAPLVRAAVDRPPCPTCHLRLPAVVVVVQAVTMALFALTAARFGVDAALPAYLFLGGSFVALSAIDLLLKLLPNRIIYPTDAVMVPLLGLAALVDGEPRRLFEALVGGVGVLGFFFVLHLISPGGMAFGDVRLSFLVGLGVGWVGLPLIIPAVFVAFVAASVVGILYGVLSGRGLKAAIPFGPFLVLGAEVAILLGPTLGRP